MTNFALPNANVTSYSKLVGKCSTLKKKGEGRGMKWKFKARRRKYGKYSTQRPKKDNLSWTGAWVLLNGNAEGPLEFIEISFYSTKKFQNIFS